MMLPTLPPAPPLCELQPMEPCGPAAAFSDAAWAFELPTGGHRALLQFGGGPEVRLHSRGHVDITAWFPEVTALRALRAARCGRTVMDGELCVLDTCGRNDADRLHRRALQRGRPASPQDRASFCVRDLLVLNGRDLRMLPWSRRRQLLRSLHGLPGGWLRLPLPVDCRGEWLCRQARALGRSELLAFHRDAPYRGGRSGACLRIACGLA
jgi:bifunctional non-homologous end joining protein LigD